MASRPNGLIRREPGVGAGPDRTGQSFRFWTGSGSSGGRVTHTWAAETSGMSGPAGQTYVKELELTGVGGRYALVIGSHCEA